MLTLPEASSEVKDAGKLPTGSSRLCNLHTTIRRPYGPRGGRRDRRG